MSATQTRRCTNCGTLFEAYVGPGTTGKRTCSKACSNARRAIGMRKAGIKSGQRSFTPPRTVSMKKQELMWDLRRRTERS